MGWGQATQYTFEPLRILHMISPLCRFQTHDISHENCVPLLLDQKQILKEKKMNSVKSFILKLKCSRNELHIFFFHSSFFLSSRNGFEIRPYDNYTCKKVLKYFIDNYGRPLFNCHFE